MLLNVRKVQASEFEDDYENVDPKESEVRLIANRNRECGYYFIGIEQCRKRMLRTAADSSNPNHDLGFLPCKRIVDAHYRCLTEDKYGYTLEETPEIGDKESKEFLKCAFKDIKPIWECRKYIDQVVRNIYRAGNSNLDDN